MQIAYLCILHLAVKAEVQKNESKKSELKDKEKDPKTAK